MLRVRKLTVVSLLTAVAGVGRLVIYGVNMSKYSADDTDCHMDGMIFRLEIRFGRGILESFHMISAFNAVRSKSIVPEASQQVKHTATCHG